MNSYRPFKVGLVLVVVGFLAYSIVQDAESGEFMVPTTGAAQGHGMSVRTETSKCGAYREP
jgi:hypothetical protein